MARTITMAGLLTRIRSRYDSRSIRQDNNVLTDWCEEAMVDLIDLVHEVNPSYFVEYGTIDVVSGTQNYNLDAALTPNIYKAYGVQIKQANGDYDWIERVPWQNIVTPSQATANRSGVGYCVMGDELWLSDKPNWAETAGIRIAYVPIPVAGAYDPFDGIMGWEEYVVLTVVVQAKEADEKDSTSTQRLLARKEAQIRRRAKIRDMGNPPKMRLSSAGGNERLRRWIPRT